MLRSATHLMKHRLDAEDGALGRLRDFLFDDRTWTVGYVVADTRRWLPGRRVLLAPQSLGQPDGEGRTIPVRLTRRQVRESPPIEEDLPVSRQCELALHEHYGWTPYWIGPGPVLARHALEPARESDPTLIEPEGDPHLRSVAEVTGYRLQARDGELGHVDDSILDDRLTGLRFFVVDTGKWLPGRQVLISPRWARDFDWADRKLMVDLTRAEVEASPLYDPSQPVDRRYEEKLYDYYGRPVRSAETVAADSRR